jgi:hypothetical protein
LCFLLGNEAAADFTDIHLRSKAEELFAAAADRLALRRRRILRKSRRGENQRSGEKKRRAHDDLRIVGLIIRATHLLPRRSSGPQRGDQLPKKR